jgi:hypothetical protein
VDSLAVEQIDGTPPFVAGSHFGYGILTWTLPFLFRTSPGYNLLARGPANWPKDGISPLEGIVEADWAVATFTMNWQVTRVGVPITFEVGEPICMLVPQRRGELESFHPTVVDVAADPEVLQGYQQWSESRDSFNASRPAPTSDPESHKLWQRDYFRGTSPSGHTAPEHQVKLDVRPFQEVRAASPTTET